MLYHRASIQRSPLFCANIVKKDPGRARQNSLATAGTNFTKPGAQNKGDLCNCDIGKTEVDVTDNKICKLFGVQ